MSTVDNLATLLLADSRFPGGGHVHSGGVEEAAVRGLVTDSVTLAAFLLGRLRTAGRVAAGFAAAAVPADLDRLRELDVELDARTPSPAQRAVSRAQGRSTARAGRSAWPSPLLTDFLAVVPRPHHAVVLGLLIGAAGGGPEQAARCAGYLSVSGPASAAVRLLGLDPFEVNAVVARLGPHIAEISRDSGTLPAASSPALDLLAESHDRVHQQEVRLFAS